MATQDHGNNVFVFTETITPKEGRSGDVLDIARRSAATLKGQPGMIQTMVTQSEKKGGEIVTTTVWGSKNDFQNFLKSDEVAALLKSDDMKNIKEWMGDYNMLMSNYVDGWHG
ncbi:MAG: antibiotic biosynthesis monooxygenase family protein [Alphaproteobacteria bacterium]